MDTKIAVTIAGSDSSGGAGIQGDLKTFSCLGVYGCTIVTGITAQNTKGIFKIKKMSPDIINAQIKTILSDIQPNSIKIGMVYDSNVINKIYLNLKKENMPIVVDPVFKSTNNDTLLLNSSLKTFINKLVPLSTVITPNIHEAEILSNIKINSAEEMVEAVYKIKKLGVKNIIIKGGHLKRKKEKREVTDILLDQNEKTYWFKNNLLDINENHGSGCSYSAAIASFLAKGYNVIESCRHANKFINESLKNLIFIGKKLPIVDTTRINYIKAKKYDVLTELKEAVNKLERIENISILIPETQMNFVYAIPEARTIQDIAGVKGRIVKLDKYAKASSCIEFGASKHVSSSVIEYMKFNRENRAAINIKYNEKIIDICRKYYSSLFKISKYNRENEPKEMKNIEGKTIKWGINHALKKNRNANLIYHTGDIGKESMIILFAENPNRILEYLKKIISKY
ncbi:MAG: bifunctional hydroxymethylpyrimidine kinase/phosphomethylpyrimidine kinase [Nitrososphaeraceae archaeon]